MKVTARKRKERRGEMEGKKRSQTEEGGKKGDVKRKKKK